VVGAHPSANGGAPRGIVPLSTSGLALGPSAKMQPRRTSILTRFVSPVLPLCKAPPGWLLRCSTARKAAWAMLLGQGTQQFCFCSNMMLVRH
jgi:hypothetical protein